MPALEASFAVLFIAIPGPTARAGNRRWLIESSRAGQTRERQDAIVVGVSHLNQDSIRQASIRQIFAAKNTDVLVHPTWQRIQGRS
jgi:hypothetical protein